MALLYPAYGREAENSCPHSFCNRRLHLPYLHGSYIHVGQRCCQCLLAALDGFKHLGAEPALRSWDTRAPSCQCASRASRRNTRNDNPGGIAVRSTFSAPSAASISLSSALLHHFLDQSRQKSSCPPSICLKLGFFAVSLLRVVDVAFAPLRGAVRNFRNIMTHCSFAEVSAQDRERFGNV